MKVEEYTPHFVGHQFRIYTDEELDAEVQGWIRASYEIGEEEWLAKSVRTKRHRGI